MTVETVETVVAAAPYAALIGHKLRPLLPDSQSALADCEVDVIQICHLLSRNGKLSLVRLTKSFPTIPNLRGIANANQNDERFKMWSVMLLCTISGLTCLLVVSGSACTHMRSISFVDRRTILSFFFNECEARCKKKLKRRAVLRTSRRKSTPVNWLLPRAVIPKFFCESQSSFSVFLCVGFPLKTSKFGITTKLCAYPFSGPGLFFIGSFLFVLLFIF